MVDYKSDVLVGKEVAIVKFRFYDPEYSGLRKFIASLNKKVLKKIGVKITSDYKTVLVNKNENKDNLEIANFCVLPIQRIQYIDESKYGREGLLVCAITRYKRKLKFTYLNLNDLILAKDDWIVKYLGLDYDHNAKEYNSLKKMIKGTAKYPIRKKKFKIDTLNNIVDIKQNTEDIQKKNIDLNVEAKLFLQEINSLCTTKQLFPKPERIKGKIRAAISDDQTQLNRNTVEDPSISGWFNENELLLKCEWVNAYMEKRGLTKDLFLEHLRIEEIIEASVDYRGTPKERIRHFVNKEIFGVKNTRVLLIKQKKMDHFLTPTES